MAEVSLRHIEKVYPNTEKKKKGKPFVMQLTLS